MCGCGLEDLIRSFFEQRHDNNEHEHPSTLLSLPSLPCLSHLDAGAEPKRKHLRAGGRPVREELVGADVAGLETRVGVPQRRGERGHRLDAAREEGDERERERERWEQRRAAARRRRGDAASRGPPAPPGRR